MRELNEWFLKKKKELGNENLSNDDFLKELFKIETQRKTVEQNEFFRKFSKEYEELLLKFNSLFELLEKNEIYSLKTTKEVDEANKSVLQYAGRLTMFAQIFSNIKNMQDSVLKVYLLANVYRSLFEVIRHLFKDLLITSSKFFENQLDSLSNNIEHKNYLIRIISSIQDKKEKFSLSPHFFEIIRLIDKKYETSFESSFLPFFDIELRNKISHESCFYEMGGIFNEDGTLFANIRQIIDKISKIFIFAFAFIQCDKGIGPALIDRLKDPKELNRAISTTKQFFKL